MSEEVSMNYQYIYLSQTILTNLNNV